MGTFRFRDFGSVVAGFFTVPWSMFVASFLYYVLLTLIAIGVQQVSDVFMAVAYGLPVAAYLVRVIGRGVRTLASVEVTTGIPDTLLTLH